MRIAIVDDISEERTLLRTRLESQFSRRNVHIDIFEYENGETFLTAAKECPFTVVFLDIYMNGSNGIDTAKELRRSDTDCLLNAKYRTTIGAIVSSIAAICFG